MTKNLTTISTTATQLSQAQQVLERETGALAEMWPPSGERIAALEPLIAALTDEVASTGELNWAIAKARKNVAEATVTAAQAAHTAAVEA